MSSSDSPADFDLDRDHPTTREDVAAQRRLTPLRIDYEAYLRFLARFRSLPTGTLRARKGPGGKPFDLED
jgi:hypothetical protein